MKNKWIKFGLIFGFVSLIAGLALGTIGLSNKGLGQLKAATKPQVVHEEFDKIENIDLNLWGRQVIIEPTSPDDKVHVTYSQTSNDYAPLSIEGANKNLVIYQTELEGIINTSPLTIIGENLNRNMEQDVVTIQIPEKMVIKQLNNNIAPGYSTEVNSVTIKELTGNMGLVLDNVIVEKGEISGEMWDFYAGQSHLKNLTISNTAMNSLSISDTILENVKLTGSTGYTQLRADNITLLGDVKLDLVDSLVFMRLSDDSKKATDFDIQLEKNSDQRTGDDAVGYYDEDYYEDYYDDVIDYYEDYYDEDGNLIHIDELIGGRSNKLSVDATIAENAETSDDLTFKKTVKDAKGKLMIKGKMINQIIIK